MEKDQKGKKYKQSDITLSSQLNINFNQYKETEREEVKSPQVIKSPTMAITPNPPEKGSASVIEHVSLNQKS